MGGRQKEKADGGGHYHKYQEVLFHNTSLYTGYSSPQFPKQKNRLNDYKIQDYQCTAFNNNVQGSFFVTVVIL